DVLLVVNFINDPRLGEGESPLVPRLLPGNAMSPRLRLATNELPQVARVAPLESRMTGERQSLQRSAFPGGSRGTRDRQDISERDIDEFWDQFDGDASDLVTDLLPLLDQA
ncbi:MAG: hypothetical protein ABI614_28105, partial [Planctomycetota bacterium]